MKYSCLSIAYLLIVILLNSCAYKQSNRGVPETETNNQIPQTIFLNFDVVRKPNNQIEAKFIDKIVVEGAIKKNNSAIKQPKPGDIKCIELDEQNKSIESFYLSNPLNKHIEYVDDHGKLATKYVELDTTQLSIRMQLHPKTHSIMLEQLTDEASKTKAIINIELNK